MLTTISDSALEDPDGVYSLHDTWRYDPRTFEPIFDGPKLCRDAAHILQGRLVCDPVAPTVVAGVMTWVLPDGWHWLTRAEATTLRPVCRVCDGHGRVIVHGASDGGHRFDQHVETIRCPVCATRTECAA